MKFRIDLCIFLVAAVCGCNHGDLKCKKKKLLLLSEIYTHYRELKNYHQSLIEYKNRLHGGVPDGNMLNIPANSNNILGGVDQVAPALSISNDPSLGGLKRDTHKMSATEIAKSIAEVEVLISDFRKLLIMLLISPEQVGLKSSVLEAKKKIIQSEINNELVDTRTKSEVVIERQAQSSSVYPIKSKATFQDSVVGSVILGRVPNFPLADSPQLIEITVEPTTSTGTTYSSKTTQSTTKRKELNTTAKPNIKNEKKKKSNGDGSKDDILDTLADYTDSMSDVHQGLVGLRMMQLLFG